ncbi:hypothetical protein BHE74_00043741 [Ensete ventricosum]|nr:hypothetical protein BHE74_00043741 [Ensete ventricosum]
MAAVLVASVEPFAIASKHPPQVKVLTPSCLGGSLEMAGSRTKRIVFLLCILLLTLVLSRCPGAPSAVAVTEARSSTTFSYGTILFWTNRYGCMFRM